MPGGAARALDVGCGAGALARELTARADRVDAVDRDPRMVGWPAATLGGVLVAVALPRIDLPAEPPVELATRA